MPKTWIVLAAFLFAGAGEVLARPPTGLALEESEQGQFRLLRAQAQDFLDFRRGRLSSRRKLEWINRCFSSPGENIYCEFMNPPSRAARIDASEASARSAGSTQEVVQLADQLEKAEVDSLRQVSEQKALRALKRFDSWPALQAVAEKVQASRFCPGAGLLTALGLKTEEFFPDPRFRQMARALYTRASACGGEDESAYKARYRLSLMHIWDGECENAAPILKRLADQKNGDYVSRALFWSAHCGSVTGQEEDRKVAELRLNQEFPLSYHGLLLSAPRELRARQIFQKAEPPVIFRSEKQPELNPLVRAVEALLSLPLRSSGAEEAESLSREILETLSGRLAGSEGTEIGFRIYVASLMSRAQMGNEVFRNLAAIFKDDPRTITRSSLELFYPLIRFDDLKRHGWRVDPFLVAALIRQESGFNQQARSVAGAMGLMQLMPQTVRGLERVSRRELLDAKTNIRLGVKYFDQLLSRYGYDAELALAAYNAGPEKVDDWLKRYPMGNRVLFFDMIPYRETRDYVALISRNYYWYRNLYGVQATSRGKPLLFTLWPGKAQSDPPNR